MQRKLFYAKQLLDKTCFATLLNNIYRTRSAEYGKLEARQLKISQGQIIVIIVLLDHKFRRMADCFATLLCRLLFQ